MMCYTKGDFEKRKGGVKMNRRIKTGAMMFCVLFFAMTAVVFMLSTATAVYSGELLPFSLAQQDSKRIDPGVYNEFRQRISRLNCAALKSLKSTLTASSSSPENRASVGYYQTLLSILGSTMASKGC